MDLKGGRNIHDGDGCVEKNGTPFSDFFVERQKDDSSECQTAEET